MPKTISSFMSTYMDSPTLRPIRLAKIEFTSQTMLLCDRKFGSSGGKFKIGSLVYFPVVMNWGEIDSGEVDFTNKVTPQGSTASFTVYNQVRLYAFRNFFSIASQEYLTANVTIYETFEGAVSNDDLNIIFKGKLERPELDGFNVLVNCVGVEVSILNKFLPEFCDPTIFPGADPDDVGKIFPIAFGRAKKVPFISIDAGSLDNLSDAITADQTTIPLSDVKGFPVSGGRVQVDVEEILYSTISGNSLVGCVRGYNSTEAVPHSQGAIVAELQTQYTFLMAHPIKTFDGVYVEHRKTGEQVLQSGNYVTYTGQTGNEHPDYPGKAAIVFDALPTLTQQINIEIEDNISVNDNIAVPDPGHDHNGEPSYTTWNFDYAVASGYVYGDSNPFGMSNACQLADGNLGTFAGLQGQGNTATIQRIALQNLDGIPSQFRVCMALGFVDSNCGATFTFMSRSVSGTGANTVYRSSWYALNETQKDWDYIQVQTATCTRTGTNPSGYTFVGEVWAEFIVDKVGGTVSVDYSGVIKSGTVVKVGTVNLVGNSVADTVIGGTVSADIQGFMADNSGYYGVDGTVIERPDLIMKKFLVLYCGLSPSADFGASCAIAGGHFDEFGVRISPVLLERKNAIDFLSQMAFESRSIQFFEDGQFQIYYLPYHSTIARTIHESRIISGSLTINFTPISEVINFLAANYNKYWVESDSKVNSTEITKSVVFGGYKPSVDTYGLLTTNSLNLEYIYGAIQALSVLGWYIGETCLPTVEISFQCANYVNDLRMGEVIRIEYVADGLMYKVVSGTFDSASTRFRIKNITKGENNLTKITAKFCTNSIPIALGEWGGDGSYLGSGTPTPAYPTTGDYVGVYQKYYAFEENEAISHDLGIAAHFGPYFPGPVGEVPPTPTNYLRRDGFLFCSLAIPAGSTIIDARLVGYAGTSYNLSVFPTHDLIFHFVDADNPSPPMSTSEYLAYSLTSGIRLPSVFKDANLYIDYTEQGNIALELQKIINRSGWSSGQNVGLIVKYPYSFDNFPEGPDAYFSYVYFPLVGEIPGLKVIFNSPWQIVISDVYWQADYINGVVGSSWSAVNSRWDFNTTAASNGGALKVRGDWFIGFRPSKIRIIHDKNPSGLNLIVYDQNGAVLASVVDYASNTEINFSWGNRSDIASIIFSVNDDTLFHVSSIEFSTIYDVSSFATTTSTSTTSSSSTTSTTKFGWSSTSTTTSSSSSSTTSTSTSTSTSSSTSSSSTFTSTSTMSTYTTATTQPPGWTNSTTTSTSSSTSSTASTASTHSTNTQSSTSSTSSTSSSSSSTGSTSSTTSSSTSSTTSTSSSSTTTTTAYVGTWTAHFDNNNWDPYLTYATWVGGHWEQFSTAGDIILQKKGSWVEGYTPTKCRVTINADSSIATFKIDVYTGSWGALGNFSGSANSGVSSHEVNLSFSGNDIGYIDIYDNGYEVEFTVTNIEFLL